MVFPALLPAGVATGATAATGAGAAGAGAGAGGGFLASVGGLGGIGSILGGAGMLGSAFGGGGDDALDFAKRLAKKGIQQRVRDAQKAGVHPLFALGANVGTGSFGGSASTGSAVSDALTGLGSAASGVASARSRQRLEALEARAEARLERNSAASAFRDFAIGQEALSRIRRSTAAAIASPGNALPTDFRPVDAIQGRAWDHSSVPWFKPGVGGADHPAYVGMTAEEAERHYGDIIQEIVGALNGIQTIWNTLRSNKSLRGRGAQTPPPSAWGGP